MMSRDRSSVHSLSTSVEMSCKMSSPEGQTDQQRLIPSVPSDGGDDPSHETRMAPFRFLDLPFDIRREIYDLCLIDYDNRISISTRGLGQIPRDKEIAYYDNCFMQFRRNGRQPLMRSDLHHDLDSGLLSTCRTIYEEAAGVLYSQNKFMFSSKLELDALVYFKHCLSLPNWNSITFLGICIPKVHKVLDPQGQECELVFDAFDEWLIKTINSLTALMALNLRLNQNVKSGQDAIVERFKAVKGPGKITLDLEPDGDDLILVDSHVFARMLEWDWIKIDRSVRCIIYPYSD